MRRLIMNRLIRIYTVCHSVLDLQLSLPFGSNECIQMQRWLMIVYPSAKCHHFHYKNRNVRERTFRHARPAKIQISLSIHRIITGRSLNSQFLGKRYIDMLTSSKTYVRNPPLTYLSGWWGRLLSYRGACHAIFPIATKLHDTYLYKTATIPHQRLLKVHIKGGSFTQVLL